MYDKLLIFGDSFGEEEAHHLKIHQRYSEEYLSLKSYHSILKSSKIFKHIENYAMGGADVFSQFKIFLDKYTGKEKILWFATNPNRITIPHPTDPKGLPYPLVGKNFAQFMLSQIEQGHEKYLDDHAKKIFQAAVYYYDCLLRPDFDDYVYTKLFEDIEKKVENDLWIIPCFRTVRFSKYALMDVYLKESKSIGFDVERDQEKYIDIRRNHMVDENHEVLAQQIINYFQKGSKFDISLFKTPSKKDFDKYIKLRHA